MKTTLNAAGGIDVSVYGDPGWGIFKEAAGQGQNGAFALNVNGNGVDFTILTPGFSFTGAGGTMPGYGDFEIHVQRSAGW
jgi:hypothetical protein